MPRRRATYKQLPLPYAPAELRQRVQLTPVISAPPAPFPPSLHALATAEGLTDEQMTQLVETASTVRGEFPVTVDEWRALYAVVRRYVWEASDAD